MTDNMSSDFLSEVASTAADSSFFAEGSNKSGFQDATNCGICKSRLGKRYLNPRHHCKFCGMSVCGSCCPSTLVVEGQMGTHRTCNVCVKIIPTANTLKERLQLLAEQLHALGGSDSPLESCDGMEEAVTACETEIIEVEGIRDKAEATKAKLSAMQQKMSETVDLDAAKEREAKQVAEGKVRDAQVEIEKANEIIATLTARSEKAEAQNANERQERELLKGKLAEQEAASKASAENAKAAQEKNSEMMEVMVSRAEKAETELEQRTNTVSSLMARIEQADADKLDAAREKEAKQVLEAKLRDAEVEVELAQNTIQALMSQAESLMASIEQADAAKLDAMREKEANQVLEVKLRDAEVEVEKAKKTIQVLMADSENAKDQGADERQRKELLEAKIAEQEAAASTLVAQEREAKQVAEAKLSDAEAEVEKAKKTIQELKAHSKTVKDQGADERQQKELLEAKIADQEASSSTLVAQEREAKQVAEAKLRNAELAADKAKATIASLTTRSEKAEAQIADERQQNQLLQKKLAEQEAMSKGSPTTPQETGKPIGQADVERCGSPVLQMVARFNKKEAEAQHAHGLVETLETPRTKAENDAKQCFQELQRTKEALISVKARVQELETRDEKESCVLKPLQGMPQGSGWKSQPLTPRVTREDDEVSQSDATSEVSMAAATPCVGSVAGSLAGSFATSEISMAPVSKNPFSNPFSEDEASWTSDDGNDPDKQEASCHICNRYMSPMYGCGVCRKSVCAQCSPSNVQLEGQESPERACNTCANMIPTAYKAQGWLKFLAAHLHAVGSGNSPFWEPPEDIEASVRMCDAELDLLEDIREKSRALEVEARELRSENKVLKSELDDLKAGIAKVPELLHEHVQKGTPESVDQAQFQEASSSSFFLCTRLK